MADKLVGLDKAGSNADSISKSSVRFVGFAARLYCRPFAFAFTNDLEAEGEGAGEVALANTGCYKNNSGLRPFLLG
jgi:hypothetical protein